jgi:5'(3')-deoxyribonucleotidase
VRILLDMDEVLCDFVGGALAAHGWTRERFRREHKAGHWEITAALGVTEDVFWATIDARGEAFWRDLRALPWLGDLVAVADRFCPDRWHVVTAPSRNPVCAAGKVAWLRTIFNERFDRYVITRHKYLLAGPGVVLVDDREETLEKFKEAGGVGVVFPTLHNSMYRHADRSVEYVRERLEFWSTRLCTSK